LKKSIISLIRNIEEKIGIEIKPRVFVTYTNRDGLGHGFAEALHRTLAHEGYDSYYFDHSSRDHLGGLVWDVIADQIDNRDLLIVLCTTALMGSFAARREYNLALTWEKQVIALPFDDAPIPRALSANIHTNCTFDQNDYVIKFQLLCVDLPDSFKNHLKDQRERLKVMEALKIGTETASFPPTEVRWGHS
jgi:hypothetical protein